MNKKLLSVAVAAAMAAPFAAQAENTVYGKIHMSVDAVDMELTNGLFDVPDLLEAYPLLGAWPGGPVGPGIGAADLFFRGSGSESSQSFWAVESNASRLGFKGSEDLGNGLKAVYKMEFQVDIDGDSAADAANIVGARNMYGGLSHAAFGTVLAGRHDTPYKVVFGKWDRFADRVADDDKIFIGPVGGFSDVRASNVLAYISPEFAGMTVSAATVAGEDNENDGLASGGWSVGGLGKWGPIKGALGYEELSATEYTGLVANALIDDDTKWGAALAWDQKPFYLGFRYEDRENVGGFNGLDVENWQVAAEFTFGNNVLKALYQDLESDLPGYMSYLDWQADAWAVGIDHKFSKRTMLYALYVDSEHDLGTPFGLPLPATSGFLGGGGLGSALAPKPGSFPTLFPNPVIGGGNAPMDMSTFSLGMIHKF